MRHVDSRLISLVIALLVLLIPAEDNLSGPDRGGTAASGPHRGPPLETI
jgi:hypothetical protein